MVSTKEWLEVVFDPRLGGVRGQGARYRDSRTGKFVPNPKGESWYCQKSPTGAHYWIIGGYTGQCRYCSDTREFPFFYQLRRRKEKIGTENN